MKLLKLEPDRIEYSVKDWTLCIIAFGIVFGFFFINYLVITGQIIPDNDTNVTTILNYTNSLAIFVAGYFFGASKSGGDKDKAISDLASSTGNGTGAGPTTTVTGDSPTVVNTPPDMAKILKVAVKPKKR